MAANDILDYEAVFRSTPAALLVIARDRTIVNGTPPFWELLGRPQAEMLGRRWQDALPVEADAVDELGDALDRVFARAGHETLPPMRLLHPSGGDGGRAWRCTATAVSAPDGPVPFVTLLAEDAAPPPSLPSPADVGSPDGVARLARTAGSQLLDLVLRSGDHHALLVADPDELRDLFMQAPSFMCLLRGADHRIEYSNAAFADLVGRQALVGRPLREAIPEIEGQVHLDLLDKAFRSGEAFVGKQMRAEFERVPGAGPEEVFISFVFQPISGPDGDVIGIFIDGNDVTDQVRAEKAQALLVRELHHRVRNTLATVQGVMNSTARTAETIEDYQWAFSGRISSLARTHSLLTEEIQQFVSLPHLLRQEIGAYADGDSGRVMLEGPDVELSSQLAVPLGMTIHELSTNAYRHGALSSPGGRVMVSWTVTPAKDKRVLTCRWVESGGPPVKPPARQGFGSMILTRVLTQQIGAKVNASYPPGGFELRADIPLVLERV